MQKFWWNLSLLPSSFITRHLTREALPPVCCCGLPRSKTQTTQTKFPPHLLFVDKSCHEKNLGKLHSSSRFNIQMVDIHKIWFKDAKDILIIIWLQQIFELNVIQIKFSRHPWGFNSQTMQSMWSSAAKITPRWICWELAVAANCCTDTFCRSVLDFKNNAKRCNLEMFYLSQFASAQRPVDNTN